MALSSGLSIILIMEIYLADKAGFCFGVKRAINTAFEQRRKGQGLLPRPADPQSPGSGAAEPGGRAHGRRFFSTQARRLPYHPFAWRASPGAGPGARKRPEHHRPYLSLCGQSAARRRILKKEGYQVVVVGEKKHPEVQSILGYAGENAVVVEKTEDIEGITLPDSRLGVVAQTTQSYSNFSEIVLRLLRLSKELKVFNTICHSTKERQEAARALAGQVDVMLVVGGRNSANTGRLASVCREEGRTDPSYRSCRRNAA